MIAQSTHYSLSPSSSRRLLAGRLCGPVGEWWWWRLLRILLEIELEEPEFAAPSRGHARSAPNSAMRVLPASWSAKLTTSNSTEDPPPPSAAAVYLNIYDISPLNHYLYWFGLGIFHSGIEGKPTIPYSPALGFLLHTYIHACLLFIINMQKVAAVVVMLSYGRRMLLLIRGSSSSLGVRYDTYLPIVSCKKDEDLTLHFIWQCMAWSMALELTNTQPAESSKSNPKAALASSSGAPCVSVRLTCPVPKSALA